LNSNVSSNLFKFNNFLKLDLSGKLSGNGLHATFLRSLEEFSLDGDLKDDERKGD